MSSTGSSPPRPKVFGVGLNKTGTTSLAAALRILGYDVTGPNKRFMPDVMNGHAEEALELAEQYDGFQDWPWPYMLEPIFSRYGTDARYVLTVRKSPQAWLRSLKSHYLQDRLGKIVRPRFSAYGPRYPFGFEREYLRQYEAHNEMVREFFRKHDAGHVFIEVCWETGDGWPELTGFLGHEIPPESFPHANATAERKWRRSRQYAHGLAAHTLARLKGRRFTDNLFTTPPRLTVP